MKLEPVAKLHKRNKATSKNLKMKTCQQIVTPLSFFFDSWSIWSNSEAGFRTYSLKKLHFR